MGKDEIDDFADAVLKQRQVTDGSSYDALRTVQLVYQIYCADSEWKNRFGLSSELPDGFEVGEQ